MGKAKKSKDASVSSNMITKPSFGSPFNLSWPEIGKEYNKLVLDELKREIPKYLLTRKLPQKKDKVLEPSDTEQDQNKQSYKEFLLVGINAVTKALEKGPLSLVLVCKSVKPWSMTQHLIPLCVMQQTEACCVAGLSNAISSALDLQSVLAIGFKIKPENPLEDLISFIKDKAPALDVPWLEIWDNEKRGMEEETSTEKNVETNLTMRSIEDFKINEKETTERNSEQKQKITTNKSQREDFHLSTPSSTENLTSESPKAVDSSSKLNHAKNKKKREKRKLDNVTYQLQETNFKMVKVPRPIKK